jgi:hypothetical protein
MRDTSLWKRMSKRLLRVSIRFYGKHMGRIPNEHGLKTERSAGSINNVALDLRRSV